jgi:hypothetical protein
MRAGNVIGEAVAGQELDAAPLLLEMGNAVGLEHDLDEGMLSVSDPRIGTGDAVLAGLDLAELEPRYGGVVDPAFQRGSAERVDVEFTAKLGQRIGPVLNLRLRRQPGGAQRTEAIGHEPTT